jgi:phasin family protein
MSESAQEKMTQALQEQQAQWMAIGTKLLESSMKLMELNVRVVKQSLDETAKSTQHLFAAKKPEEVFAIDQGKMQEKLNQALAYANEINSITSELTSEFSQSTQAKLSEAVSKASEFVAHINPAAGDFSNKPLEQLFSQFGNSQHGYQQWVEASKKFADSLGVKLPAAPESVAEKKRAAKK